MHPLRPRVKKCKKCDPPVNDWWKGLWFLGVCKYWGTSINTCVEEPNFLKWANKWIFHVWDNGLMLSKMHFHPASPVDFYPESRYTGLSVWLKPRKPNRGLLTGMPWLAASVPPHDRWWVEFHPASLPQGSTSLSTVSYHKVKTVIRVLIFILEITTGGIWPQNAHMDALNHNWQNMPTGESMDIRCECAIRMTHWSKLYCEGAIVMKLRIGIWL